MNATETPTTNAKPQPRSGPAPLTQAEALSMLASALAYCRQSGLTLRAANHGGRLVVAIDGARLDGMTLRPLPAADVPSSQSEQVPV